MRSNANDLSYYLVNMDGYICAFHNDRIDRSTIPDGLFCYDVRDSDHTDGTFSEVQPSVLVNHWGTILTKEEIPMNEYGCYWPKDGDPLFGPTVSLADFRDTSQENLRKQFDAYLARLEALQKAQKPTLDSMIGDAEQRSGKVTQSPREAPEPER